MNSALKPPAAQLGTSSQGRVLTRWAAYALAVLNELGGPVFWPIIMLAGGVGGALIGGLAGSVVHAVRSKGRRAG